MKNIELATALKEFEQENQSKRLSSATVRYYRSFIGQFMRWLPETGDAPIIAADLFKGYKAHLSESKANSISVNTNLRAVRRFFNFCIEREYCLPFKMKLLREERHIKQTFSKDEIGKIFKYEDPSCRESVIAVLLLSTGVRSASLRSVMVRDVSFGDDLIFFRHSKNKEEFSLPIPNGVSQLLEKYIAVHKLSESAWLFPNAAGNRFDDVGLNRFTARYLEQIGINKKGIHIFRHTFARSLIENGCDAITLMRCLNHKSIRQSEQYVALYGRDLRFAVEKYNP